MCSQSKNVLINTCGCDLYDVVENERVMRVKNDKVKKLEVTK